MYPTLLTIHSLLRSLVLAGFALLIVRMATQYRRPGPLAGGDALASRIFDQAFGLQILLGLTLLLAASPFPRLAAADPASLTEDRLVFFWVIRHPMSMLLAFGIWHTGRGRAKRRPEKTYAVYAFTLALSLLLVVSAIPWPWFSYGRPLLRYF
jgi:hypothetical protein